MHVPIAPLRLPADTARHRLRNGVGHLLATRVPDDGRPDAVLPCCITVADDLEVRGHLFEPFAKGHVVRLCELGDGGVGGGHHKTAPQSTQMRTIEYEAMVMVELTAVIVAVVLVDK